MTTITPARLPSIPTSVDAFADATTAINFALDCLEDFEVGSFLADRRAGRDLGGWLSHVTSVRREASSCYGPLSVPPHLADC
ncbi:hypothetical protein [Mesorhizobium ventifaucium]|uniref:Uncharacterized protein n=1 Tax=Mesorhizobium ventifaucium TaxID=666020 RepID=A0ABN8K4R5_9HYPH|nr:hypothetical protein [Mesorhizobium ventifaucium]CAH2405255.1 hypothetical protein MES4922_40150 [Mesorhizobium ventifaucium]